MRRDYRVPMLPLPHDLETKRVLLQLNRASRRLGELKGVAPMIPHETILLETLMLQEARESSAVENIVTTRDDLFRAGLEMQQMVAMALAKEVLDDLLALPILYLSRYIMRHKGEYYRLLQAVRDAAPANALEWEDWVLFMLKGIEVTAADTIDLIKSISSLMGEYEERLRQLFRKQYRHELLSNLFSHPYTKIEHVEWEMMVQRKTASKYLNQIVDSGLLVRERYGNTNYYMNTALIHLFMTHGSKEGYGSGTSADAVA